MAAEQTTLEEMGMAEDAYAHFIAALRYIVLEKKRISQVALAREVQVSHNHLNAVLHGREGRDGKPVKASWELQQSLAEVLGYNFRDFLEMGEKLLEGFPVEVRMQKIEAGSVLIPVSKKEPVDYMDPADFRHAAMSLAETYSKCNDRLRMWRTYFEHLPFPALVIKANVVVYQNAQSRKWGQAAGSPLCKNCYERGICNAKNCDSDDCPLCIAINVGVASTKYRVSEGEVYKVDATPFHSGGFDYVILTATAMDVAEIINQATIGKISIRPSRRKND